MVNITPSSYDKGFTLVELAIALMVIGLLIGGVLKGQELIENAKITSVIRQIKAYDTAALIFRNTYGALPGDIKRPNRIPNCTEEICTLGGNGNGKILYNDTSTSSIEVFNFFPHLTKAGMIQGPEGGTEEEFSSASSGSELFFPTTSLDVTINEIIHGSMVGFSIITTQPTPRTDQHYYYFYNTNSLVASRIDQKMDDGSPIRGDVLLEEINVCADPDDENTYTQEPMDNCAIFILGGF